MAGRMSVWDLECSSSSNSIIAVTTKEKILPRPRLLLMPFEDVGALLLVVLGLHLAGDQSPVLFLTLQFQRQSRSMYLSTTWMKELNAPLARLLVVPNWEMLLTLLRTRDLAEGSR